MESIPHKVHFQELMEPQATSIWNGQHVQIYGFLHHSQEGNWILSSQATLRSCCFHQSLEQKTSIQLIRPLPSSKKGQASLIQGTLFARDTKEGTFWILQDASIVEQSIVYPTAFPFLLGIGVFTVLLIYFFKFTSKRYLKES